MSRRMVLLLGFLATVGSSALAAETFVVDQAHSEVGFQIRHFTSKVRGRFTDFEGTVQIDRTKLGAAAVEFAIRTASINTDNADRDEHLRSADFFDVKKYPEIRFRSSKVVAKGKDRFDVQGTLTMHGVGKPVSLAVSLLGFANAGDTEKAGFEASVVLNRKDFGIVWNNALEGGGFVLSDEVWVSINIEADRKKDAVGSTHVNSPGNDDHVSLSFRSGLASPLVTALARRIGASVGTGSLVRKSTMIRLQRSGFSTSSPWDVPGTIASSAFGKPR